MTRLDRFADAWLASGNYVLGVDLQRKDFERYGRKSYLRGEWRDRGWWYYYLYAAAIKVPLGLWLFGLLAFTGRTLGLIPCPLRGRLGWGFFRDEFILLFPGVFIFAFVSSQTGFNEHFRYVLPAFPYFFIWASQAMNVFRTT